MNSSLNACGRFALPAFLWAFSLLPALAQQSGGDAVAVDRQMREWHSDLETQWKPLLSRAGQPSEGLLLKVRVPGDPLTLGKPVDLVLSVENVSEHRVSFSVERYDVPLALVRDDKGKPVARTEEGIRRYGPTWWWAAGVGSSVIRELAPGQARETIFPLTRYYVFSTPGTYTVLVAESTAWSRVAKPVLIHIRKAETPAGAENGDLKAGEAGRKKGPSPVK